MNCTIIVFITGSSSYSNLSLSFKDILLSFTKCLIKKIVYIGCHAMPVPRASSPKILSPKNQFRCPFQAADVFVRCVKSCQSSGCSVCGSKSKVKVMPIGKNLPQPLMEMFNSTETSLSKMNKRIEFQNLHFDRTLKLRRKKRKNLLEKCHLFKSPLSRRIKRKEALKKMEVKLKHKKAAMSRMNKTKMTLETKRSQQKRMLRPSDSTNKIMFAGAIVSAPPQSFLSPEQPPSSFLVSQLLSSAGVQEPD